MRKCKIFFLTPEIYPFVRSSPGGELAGSLPIYLQNQGHEVRVMMPKYSLINERKHIIRDIIRLRDIPVPFLNKTIPVSVKSGFLPESKTQTYFLDCEAYFRRSDIYTDKRTGQPFKDNAERFIFLAKAAIETLKTLGWQPDIVHCNDWPSGILPALIRKEQKENAFFRKTAVVTSINDNETAGLFDKSALNMAELDLSAADAQKMIHNHKFSFLKSAITYADAVMIPTYLKKTKSPADGLLQQSKNLFKIQSGANYHLWNPNSTILTKPFTAEKYHRRKLNRDTFLQERKTGFNADQMILGILTDNFEKDYKCILELLKVLQDIPLQFILLTDKSPNQAAFRQHLLKHQTQKIFILPDPDDQFKPVFYAVCDLFFVPGDNYYEQRHYLNGIRYGCLPLIVGNSEVLTLFTPIQWPSFNGQAVVADTYKAVPAMIQQTLKIYSQTETWEPAIIRLMKHDLSWNRFLPQVIKVYEKALSRIK